MACVVLVLGTACGPAMPQYDYSQEPDPRKSEYVIGVSDQLQVTVWRNPEASATVTVRPDGTITLPLIGDLRAAGRTPSQLRDEITRRQAAYVKDESATVTVAVLAVNSYRFTVAGEVTSPGVYGSPRYLTVVEAIAMAGGFTRFAKRNKITIVRHSANSRNTYQVPIAWDFLVSGEHEEMNLVVLPGDTIMVP